MSVKRALLSSTIIAGTAIVSAWAITPALAQEAPAPAPAAAPSEQAALDAVQTETAGQPAETADDAVEGVVVTGSRIPRPNLEQPTPVATVTEELIENSGTSNLGDIVAELPALNSNGTVRANADSFGDTGGLNFPDLRGLGVSRTLTLVNGKRHVAGYPGTQAVDLNSIPTALVERVEVITGGASAVYGSDAVSGVINIILKDDFEGIEIGAQAGAPTEGGYGENHSAYVTIGSNFADDRGNATFTLFRDHQGAIKASDIRALNEYGTIINPADTGENDGIADLLLVPGVVSEFIDENGVILGFDFTTGAITPASGFRADGTPVEQPVRVGENSFAFGTFATPCETCFGIEDWLLISPDLDRTGLVGTITYDLAPNLRFKGEAKLVRTELFDYVQPSFTFGDYLLEPDNAFITPAVAAELAELAPTELPLISRFLGDLGPRTSDIERQTIRLVAGLEGGFDARFADLDWEASYVFGETSNTVRAGGSRITGNFEAAIDSVINPATGQPDCRVDVPSAQYPGYTPPAGMTGGDCIPYNPFGQQNSQAAIDYVTFDSTAFQKVTQQVASLLWNFDTDRFLNLPGGPIAFAGGLEWREERSENINDAFVKSGLTETAPQPDATGGFDVTEAFVEFNAPILSGARFAHRLSVDGAVRIADYSTIGRAEAWKLGAIWAPVADLSFRGTYSEAVRAPNITEAFLPPTATFFAIADPCDADRVGSDPDRAANCAALGVPAGFQASDNVSVDGIASGNPDLDAEQASSFTVGAVFRPRWAPGLAVTLDYYDIEIQDAISFVAAQDIVDNCVDATGGPDPAFCDLVTRGADDNITLVESTYVNASQLTTKGWDFQVTYQTDVDGIAARLGLDRWLNGRLTASVYVNHLDELRINEFQDRPNEVDWEEGEIGDPEWSAITSIGYRQGPLSLNWQARYEGSVIRYEATPTNADGSPLGTCEDTSPCEVEAVWYHDFVGRYRIDRVGRGLELYAGVNNAFDEEIPLGLSIGTGAAYDIAGRFVFAGLKASF